MSCTCVECTGSAVEAEAQYGHGQLIDDSVVEAAVARSAMHIMTCSCEYCAIARKYGDTTAAHEAKITCLRELAVLANIGNADPDATGSLAIRALEKYMNAIGQTEVMAAYNSVARY